MPAPAAGIVSEEKGARIDRFLAAAWLTRDDRAGDAPGTANSRAKRQLAPTWVRAALARLTKGLVPTPAPIFAIACATQDGRATVLVGLAASIGAGISVGFAERASDVGQISGRGSFLRLMVASCVITIVGGPWHAQPSLDADT